MLFPGPVPGAVSGAVSGVVSGADASIASIPLSSALPAAGKCAGMMEDLVLQGWSQQNIFLPSDLTIALAAECRLLSAQGAMAPASTGRHVAGAMRAVPSLAIRGDSIRWLESGQSAACDQYLQIMETLRLALNRSLYLGLVDYESHFAFYVPGTGYLKHLDRFRDDDRRTVSVVIYLNPDWLPEHGGALRLHPAEAAVQDISPVASRMVVFLSEELLHEVLPASRERLSLAGWFRRRPC